MTNELKALYEQAPRFDQGDLRFSQTYLEAEHAAASIEEELKICCGVKAVSLLQKYAEALYDIAELEGQHYFQQGYRAGQAAKKRAG